MEIYSVGPDEVYAEDVARLSYLWLVYEYEIGDYCGDGDAIGFDGVDLWHHSLGHCSCFGPEEGLQATPVKVHLSELEGSDSVLAHEYSPALVAKVKELMGV